MVRSSRLAHDGSTLLSWLAGPGRSRAPAWCSSSRSVLRRQPAGRPYPIDVERPRDAQRPRERRAPLGTGEALRDGVQPCTTPGEPTPRVRDAVPVHRDDPQQIVGRRPGTAADAGPDRPSVGSEADRGGGPAVRGSRPGRRTDLKCTASPVSGAPYRGCGPLRRARPTGAADPDASAAGDPRVGVAADVDAPPGEPRREPGVLPLLADRERELEVRHDHAGRPGPRVEHASPRPPSTATGRCRRTSRGRPTSR